MDPSSLALEPMAEKNRESLLSLYHNPTVEGSLGGVQRFAKAQHIPVQ